MTSARAWRPKKDPWMPPDYDDDVIWAVRAFAKGHALEHQQRLVWDWLSYVAGVGEEWQDLVYRPGANGERDTTFASGRQFPMLQMKKLLRAELTPKQADEAPRRENPLEPARLPPRKRRKKKARR